MNSRFADFGEPLDEEEETYVYLVFEVGICGTTLWKNVGSRNRRNS